MFKSNKIVEIILKEMRGIIDDNRFNDIKNLSGIDLLETQFIASHELLGVIDDFIIKDESFLEYIMPEHNEDLKPLIDKYGLPKIISALISTLMDRLLAGYIVESTTNDLIKKNELEDLYMEFLKIFKEFISKDTVKILDKYTQNIDNKDSSSDSSKATSEISRETRAKMFVELINEGSMSIKNLADQLDKGSININDVFTLLTLEQHKELLKEAQRRDALDSYENKNEGFDAIGIEIGPDSVKKLDKLSLDLEKAVREIVRGGIVELDEILKELQERINSIIKLI